MTGRFAPTPSGELHVGNLRTALIAWLSARAADEPFVVRLDDLDPLTRSGDHAAGQLADLAMLGIDWDGPVVRQRDRFDRYHEVIDGLIASGATYPCFCTRREIREAAAAPHGAGPEGAYPGTCRDLPAAEVHRRELERTPAVRLRAGGVERAIHDEVAGEARGAVDDFVIRRNDGVPAYNLAVVLDDWDQGVTQVVRGDDLLVTTPRQVLLQELVGAPTPRYLHVPLVVGPSGERLAKRDGAVTLRELNGVGVELADVVAALASSIGIGTPGEVPDTASMVHRFAATELRRLATGAVSIEQLRRHWTPGADRAGPQRGPAR